MQFTLRALLLGVAAFSLLATVCFAMPRAAANLLMSVVSLILPTVYLAGAIYASKAQKAFCIGALLPYAIGWFQKGGISQITQIWIGATIMAHAAIGSERLSHLENPSLVYFTELRGTFYIGQSFIAFVSMVLGFVAVAVRRVVSTE